MKTNEQTSNQITLNQTDANRATVLRLYNEYYNLRKLELLPELISPLFVNHSTHEEGQEAVSKMNRALSHAFEGLHFEIGDAFAEGTIVIVTWKWIGRHVNAFRNLEPSGKLVENEGLVVHRLAQGLITDIWAMVSGLRDVTGPDGDPA